jgi:hypothetical protein
MRRPGARAVVVALALFIVLSILLAVFAVNPRLDRQGASTPAPSPEEIEKAQTERRREAERRQEAERQEAERRREAVRQREVERQQQLEREREGARQKNRNTVKACVSIVRERSDARLYKGSSNFDAYATGEYAESFRYFGTAQERFQFEKCMAEHGIPLADQSDDTKRK